MVSLSFYQSDFPAACFEQLRGYCAIGGHFSFYWIEFVLADWRVILRPWSMAIGGFFHFTSRWSFHCPLSHSNRLSLAHSGAACVIWWQFWHNGIHPASQLSNLPARPYLWWHSVALAPQLPHGVGNDNHSWTRFRYCTSCLALVAVARRIGLRLIITFTLPCCCHLPIVCLGFLGGLIGFGLWFGPKYFDAFLIAFCIAGVIWTLPQ